MPGIYIAFQSDSATASPIKASDGSIRTVLGLVDALGVQ